MIASYTRESGVRLLEREISAACRKTAYKIVAGETKAVSINTGMLEDFLGVRNTGRSISRERMKLALSWGSHGRRRAAKRSTSR